MRISQKLLWLMVIISIATGTWSVRSTVTGREQQKQEGKQIVIGGLSATGQRNQPKDQVVTGVLNIERVFPEVTQLVVARIKSDRLGNCFILNSADHSIVMYDHHLKFVRRIGRIGDGPGELKYPEDFALDQKGQLYVADTGNNRVQVFDSNGTHLRHFRVSEPISIAVMSSGEILIVGRRDDQLIRVYSPEGRSLKSIGTPIDTGVKDPKLNAYLNRGTVLVDHNDHIYYMFRRLLKPVVRKYNLDGKLLMEIHPQGAEMPDILSRAQAKLQEAIKKSELSSKSTLNAIQIDSATGNIWIAPSGPVLYVYSARGRKLAEYRLRDSSGNLHGAIDFTLLRGLKGCLVNPAGCFLFDMPKIG